MLMAPVTFSIVLCPPPSAVKYIGQETIFCDHKCILLTIYWSYAELYFCPPMTAPPIRFTPLPRSILAWSTIFRPAIVMVIWRAPSYKLGPLICELRRFYVHSSSFEGFSNLLFKCLVKDRFHTN